MDVKFLLTNLSLIFNALHVLLVLAIEQLLIEIAIVTENQHPQHIHAFSNYFCALWGKVNI